MSGHTGLSALRTGIVRALLLAVPVVMLALAWGAIRGASGERLATVAMINMVLVVALQLFSGNSGVISFGHVGFAAVGAYSVAIFSTPVMIKQGRIPDAPFGLGSVEFGLGVSILLALGVVVAVGLFVGVVIMRLSGISATIVTLAFLIVMYNVLNNWVDLTGGAEAFYGIPQLPSRWIVVATLVIMLVAASAYKSSATGLQLQASRDDELAATAMGVDVPSLRLWAFLASAVGAGAAGILLALFLTAVSPNDFYLNLTFITVAMLVLGGKTSTTGAVIGVIIITVGDEIFRWVGDGPTIGSVSLPLLPGVNGLFLGTVIIVFMIWRPSGITGNWEIDDLLPRRWRTASVKVAPATEHGQFDPLPLKAKDAEKHFSGLRAVDGVTLEVGSGEIVGLIGPNGAGKTTMMNLLSGVLEPDSGSITIGDEPLPRKLHNVARHGVARTFQNIRLFGSLTVAQNVEVTAHVANRHGLTAHGGAPLRLSVPQLLDHFDLLELADRPSGTLAYGEQRRLEIARAAAVGWNVVLLDEPVAGMNEVESESLRLSIRRLHELMGAGVLVVDHDLSFILGLCQRIYVLDAGRIIAQGTPDEIANNPAVIEAYIGARGTAQSDIDQAHGEGDSA